MKTARRTEAADLIRAGLRDLDFAITCLESGEGKAIRTDTALDRLERARACFVTAGQKSRKA